MVPLSLSKRISFGKITPSSTVTHVVNQIKTKPIGVILNMLVKVGNTMVPTDFVVIDFRDHVVPMT
jgi:hypothetical protein